LKASSQLPAIEVPVRHQPRSADDEALRFARIATTISGRLGVAIGPPMLSVRRTDRTAAKTAVR